MELEQDVIGWNAFNWLSECHLFHPVTLLYPLTFQQVFLPKALSTFLTREIHQW